MIYSFLLTTSPRLVRNVAKTFRFEQNFDEKTKEKAEPTQVCKQFSLNFSSKFSQIWTFASRGEQLPFLLCILLSALYSCNCNASTQGLGAVAANIYEPVSLVIQLVRAVSFISGFGLVLGSILKFIDYRRNPVAVRLSTVFFMFFFGVALILVGLIPLHAVNNHEA